MKTFYATLSTFALLLVMICANAFYIKSTARELTVRILPFLNEDYTEAEIAALGAYWEKQRTLVGLSVPAEAVFAIDEHLTEMRSALACHSKDDMDTAARLALDAVSRMKCIEGFSLDAVL